MDFHLVWNDADPDTPILERSQSGVREAAIAESSGKILAVLVRTSGRRLLSSLRSNRSVKSRCAVRGGYFSHVVRLLTASSLRGPRHALVTGPTEDDRASLGI